MAFLSILPIAAISWYTVNIARNAWQDGNKGGAVAFGLLALTTFLFPTLFLLMR